MLHLLHSQYIQSILCTTQIPFDLFSSAVTTQDLSSQEVGTIHWEPTIVSLQIYHWIRHWKVLTFYNHNEKLNSQESILDAHFVYVSVVATTAINIFYLNNYYDLLWEWYRQTSHMLNSWNSLFQVCHYNNKIYTCKHITCMYVYIDVNVHIFLFIQHTHMEIQE